MATEFIRVKSKSTGHEYSLPKEAYDKDAHEKVSGPATVDGLIVPPVYNENVGDVVAVDETVVPKPAPSEKK